MSFAVGDPPGPDQPYLYLGVACLFAIGWLVCQAVLVNYPHWQTLGLQVRIVANQPDKQGPPRIFPGSLIESQRLDTILDKRNGHRAAWVRFA